MCLLTFPSISLWNKDVEKKCLAIYMQGQTILARHLGKIESLMRDRSQNIACKCHFTVSIWCHGVFLPQKKTESESKEKFPARTLCHKEATKNHNKILLYHAVVSISDLFSYYSTYNPPHKTLLEFDFILSSRLYFLLI